MDAGWSRRRLCELAGIDHGYYSRAVLGTREPSVGVLTALARALGGDLAVRFFPKTGPTVRDRHQSAIVEELLRIADGRWSRSVEVRVTRPVRGSIDVTLDARRPATIVACEVQSRIDRLEQTVRWSAEKAAALPSSDMWRTFTEAPTIHRLLVLRSTAATRALARDFELTLAAAYPAPADAAYRALTTGDAPWPGSAILWADLRAGAARIMPYPPRGVSLGR